MKLKAATEIGIDGTLHKFPRSITESEVFHDLHTIHAKWRVLKLY